MNEIGVTPEGLDEDFGLSYVRGLSDLVGPKDG
jgi:hypothetical protein